MEIGQKGKKQLHWNLDDILKPEDFDKLYGEVEKELSNYDGFFKKMRPNMGANTFRQFVDFEQSLMEKIYRLFCMPQLMQSVDQKSEKARLFLSRAQDLYVKLDDASRKTEHWIKGKEVEGKKVLDDNNAKRLFSSVSDLEYVLDSGRNASVHTLTEPEESIITKKDCNVTSVLTELRDLIETDQEYSFKPKNKRSKKIKTSSELLKHVSSPDPDKREAAYRALFTEYKKNLDKYFVIYQAVVKNWDSMAELRRYKSPIAIRNAGNDVPDKAVETLLQVCSDNKDIFQRYFRFKAKELGINKLRRFDLYAPLKNKETNVSFSEAKNLVLDTLNEFCPGFGKRAEQIFDAEHIDSHPDPVKTDGAFCMTISPNIAPYILLNFAGKSGDVSTLAHELGHGIHALYANNHHLSSQHAGLPLCETASTFSEMVLFEKLFEKADPEAKKSMLSKRMSGSFATVLRQSDFINFEIKAHEAISKGTTAEELSDIYFDVLKKQFGSSVDVDPMFRYEWSYIPHIVNTPFYCYAYNFGELLSLALFNKYKTQGPKFIPKIEKILAVGGSKSPDSILKKVGVNMCSYDFWQGSFDMIRGWQKNLEGYK